MLAWNSIPRASAERSAVTSSAAAGAEVKPKASRPAAVTPMARAV